MIRAHEKRCSVCGESHRGANYLPSPKEIRRECAKIRRGWNATTRASRIVQLVKHWMPPGTVGQERVDQLRGPGVDVDA